MPVYLVGLAPSIQLAMLLIPSGCIGPSTADATRARDEMVEVFPPVQVGSTAPPRWAQPAAHLQQTHRSGGVVTEVGGGFGGGKVRRRHDTSGPDGNERGFHGIGVSSSA